MFASPALTTYFPVAILVVTSVAIITHSSLVEATFSPISFLISKSSGSRCCSSRHPRMAPSYNAMEAFDDGTPLDFYRQQVSRMYGGGGSGGGGGGGYSSGRGGGGGGGYRMGGKSGGSAGPALQLSQLYKNSFGYQNMLMGGGFMKTNGFGPAGTLTSKKWRGYGKALLKNSKSGYGHGDRLTNVHVVPSGATDEYKDSYVTMIADTLKRGAY